MLGHGGPGDKISDGRALALSYLTSVDTTVGGADTISTGLGGKDIVVGGVDGDTITTNRGQVASTDADGDAIVLGDNGLVDFATVDAVPGDLDRIWVLDPDTGGSDVITTGAGNDVVIAGEDGELISEGAGKVRAAGQVTTVAAPLGDTVFAGAGNDIVLGDDGRVTYFNTVAVPSGIQRIETTDLNIGGPDRIGGGQGQDILIGGGWNDDIDGDADDDLIFGDQVILDRRPGVITNPRFQLLTIAGRIYSRSDLDTLLSQIADNSGQLLIQNLAQNYVDRSVLPYWVEYEIKELWHSLAIQAGSGGVAGPDSFGADYIAGGGGDDVIFGQLGNDVIQGDGDIEARPDSVKVGVERTPLTGVTYLDPLGQLVIHALVRGRERRRRLHRGRRRRRHRVRRPRPGRHHRRQLVAVHARPRHGAAGRRRLPVRRRRHADRAGEHAPRPRRTAATRTRSSATTATSTGSSSAAGALLSFNYDNGYGEQLVVRGITLLDYMPGGPDFRPDCYGVPGAPAPLANQPACVADDAAHGGDDEVHGESGDDWIYAGRGNDRLFGDGDDDDIIGGWGHDWISGGAGQDGILGDDGRIFTSRNGTAEPLYGVAATTQTDIASPGSAQTATLNPTGQLNKAFDVTPFNLRPNGLGGDDPLFDPAYADDVIFGGLGDDFLHGGSGDDAISGAEALAESYAGRYDAGGNLIGLVRSDFTRPWNAGNILHFGEVTNGSGRAGQFPYYDEFDPLRAIVLEDNGTLAKDGTGQALPAQLDRDRRAGRGHTSTPTATTSSSATSATTGSSAAPARTRCGAAGATTCSTPTTTSSRRPTASTPPPTRMPSYVDRAFGGAGLDVLIGNTGADRLIDWVGEFNSYAVPFNPFGLGTVSRQLAPGLKEFLYALSRAQGSDPTRLAEVGGDPLRLGEPAGRDRPDRAGGRGLAGPDRRPARPAGPDRRRRPQGRPLLGRLQRRLDAGLRARQRPLVGPERRADGVGDQPHDRRRGRLLPRHLPADVLRDRRADPGREAARRLERQRLHHLRLLLADELQVRGHQRLDEQVRDGLPRRVRLARGAADERPDQAGPVLQPARRGERHGRHGHGQRRGGVRVRLPGPDRRRPARAAQQGPDRHGLAGRPRHVRQRRRPGAQAADDARRDGDVRRRRRPALHAARRDHRRVDRRGRPPGHDRARRSREHRS